MTLVTLVTLFSATPYRVKSRESFGIIRHNRHRHRCGRRVLSPKTGRNSVKHRTPRQSAREQCLACCGDDVSEIARCTARAPVGSLDPSGCHLWPYRLGRGCDRTRDPRPPSRLKAIRRECLMCQGGSPAGVRECTAPHCALYPFRLGQSPARAGKARTAAQVAAAAAAAGRLRRRGATVSQTAP